MIIRNRNDSIVMITQHDHAHISGSFAKSWKSTYFSGEFLKKSVELAITEHDRSWIPIDAHPFMNDETELPYSFIDFPLVPKLIFYKHGIDEVEKLDAYAGFLCSAHYVRFTDRSSGKVAKEFVQSETERQEKIKSKLVDFNEESFNFHFELLKFCDNLSLYACLNELGAKKEDEHYFFKKGLPIPPTFTFFKGDRLAIHWQDEETIVLSQFPFSDPLTIQLHKRVVPKSLIKEVGLAVAYKQIPIEVDAIQIIGT